MSALTAPPTQSSQNSTQMNATPPPAFPATPDHPRVPERNQLDITDLEEPPPYTPRPSTLSGETTIEQGPSRPFQPAPQTPSQQRWPTVASHSTGTSSLSSSASALNRSAGSLLNQLTTTLTNSVNAAINNLNSPPPQPPRLQQHWTSYPGGRQQASHPPQNSLLPPPPRHPSSMSSSSSTGSLTPSSEFARDFYAVGSVDEPDVVNNTTYSPPPGSPPPRLPPRPTNISNASTTSSLTPNDGRPTVHPSIGHPLLKDGKLLVYPKGYECSKCQNIGYKGADPLRPCKKCWSKYAKPFTGPLVYSFSPSSSQNGRPSTSAENFQRPLPHPPPPQAPPIPPALSFNPPPAHFAPGGYMTDHHGGFYSPPTGVHPTHTRIGRDIVEIGRPPPGAIVYQAGDPRIGGRLCWRCDGKGNTSYMLLDRITCPVCGGVGRTFDR